MKSILSFIFILLASSFAFAVTVECKTYLNLSEVASNTAMTVKKQSVSVSRDDDSAWVFITEKTDGIFMVEAYIPELEQRIYAEGKLEPGQELIASVWSRPMIVDVSCKIK